MLRNCSTSCYRQLCFEVNNSVASQQPCVFGRPWLLSQICNGSSTAVQCTTTDAAILVILCSSTTKPSWQAAVCGMFLAHCAGCYRHTCTAAVMHLHMHHIQAVQLSCGSTSGVADTSHTPQCSFFPLLTDMTCACMTLNAGILRSTSSRLPVLVGEEAGCNTSQPSPLPSQLPPPFQDARHDKALPPPWPQSIRRGTSPPVPPPAAPAA
mmetsp:Transcript_39859/g.88608  ORF Transcript_39859/g.88608 Transcript_39859/m.88608 type:complete len:210 (+) Transcript_39859:1627-2256(+)